MKVEDILSDLEDLEEEANRLKDKHSKAVGRETEILSRLQKEFKVTSLEEAEALHTKREKLLKEKKEALEEEYSEIKEEFSRWKSKK